jgi:hypothetical protein
VKNITYRFDKKYIFTKELKPDLYPLKLWFKEDLINWMAEWHAATVKTEMFQAKIVTNYTTVAGVPQTVTEIYKIYSDTPMSSKLRLLRWQLLLVLAPLAGRLVLDGGKSRVTSVEISLEWVALGEHI